LGKSLQQSNKSIEQTSKDPNVVYLTQYEITDAPIQDRRYRRLPNPIKETIEALHFTAQENPMKAIPELNELIKKYPDLPMLYNYLSVAFSRAGRNEDAESVIQENYRRNPDYLFARLNYAEICLAKGEYERVAEIFDHKFDLKLLYPQRKRFHISEVVGFMGIMGWYFMEKGEREIAEKYEEILQQIAPDNFMTKCFHRLIYHGLFRRLLTRQLSRQE
jgi:tetratricopeptide (TPR) repeat protein